MEAAGSHQALRLTQGQSQLADSARLCRPALQSHLELTLG
jgi:hypothetical protein